MIGGFTGSEAADIHRFDLRTKQWEEVAVASSGLVAPFTGRSVFARAAHACDSAACDHSGHIILFGGEVDPSELGHAGAGHFTDTVYCMDPVTKEWHGVHAAAGEGPGPLGWMASTSVPEGMVVHGGINKNNERQGGMFLLDVHS